MSYIIHFNPNHDPKTGQFTFGKVPIMYKWERDTTRIFKEGPLRFWAGEMKRLSKIGLLNYYLEEFYDTFVTEDTISNGKNFVEMKTKNI